MARATVKKIAMSQADIARMAGVDQSTVSYALNNSTNISAETRQRILEICQKVNYQPNAHARSLRQGNSDLIGVVTSPIRNLFQANLVDHIGANLRKVGYQMCLRSLFNIQTKQREQVLELLDRRAAGVIVETSHPALFSDLSDIIGRVMPLVIIGPTLEGASSVSCDRYAAGRMAAEHLLSLGRRRLGIFYGSSRGQDGGPKADGFRSVAIEHKLEVVDILLPEGAFPKVAEGAAPSAVDVGYAGAEILCKNRVNTDALFCTSDELAMGMVTGLREMGIQVPSQIAIVGFDDIPQARYAAVPLTTIRQPIADYASVAVQMLLSQLEHDSDFVRTSKSFSCNLIVRASTDITWTPPRILT